MNENTKLIFVETIGNPKLDIPDIKELSTLAHENGIPLIVDNTVTTPYLIKPILYGADIVIHSTSKYINGSGLRMDRLCDNALILAKSLKENKKVEFVNFPGLDDNEYHNLASNQFGGIFGAIVTIRVDTKEKAFKLINTLKYASNLANIGDVRTLVIHPASTIYAGYSVAEKEKMGVFEDLIRISVGIEDIEDLIDDFNQALDII